MLQEASAISFATELVTHPSPLPEFFKPDFHDPEPGDSHTCSLAINQGEDSAMEKKG